MTRWTYDPSTGACVAKRYPDNSQVSYSHAPDGLPLVTTLASGRTTANVYDAKRRLVASVSTDGAGDAGYAYDVFGKMTAASNAVAAYAYAPHRNGTVSNFVNGAAVGGFVYGRDALGRIVRRDEVGGDTATFAYDEVGQVVQVSSYPLLSTNYQLSSYSYDQIGNIAGSEALAYTADGGVAGLDGRILAYDSEMRLTSVVTGGVTVAAYDYDAFGRRVRKTTPTATTLYFYDGWNLVREETSGANGGTVEYAWGKDVAGSLDGAGGIGGLLYLKRNGSVYVPLYDANGNIIAYVDANGSVVAEYTYDAFGNEITQTTNSPTANHFSFRYSTKYWDEETGFYYYGYRYYAPPQSRWLTRDPLEEQGGLNLHAFCENDGVNKYDALGQWAWVNEYIQTGRNFWMNVAEYYFRRKRNRPLSAMLLDLSVSGLGVDNHVQFDEGSDLARALKVSKECHSALDKIIKSSGRRRIIKDELSVPVNFTQGDLFTAVGHATLYYKGKICKTLYSGWFVNLRIRVHDRYDFDFWLRTMPDNPIATIGVDLAWGDQLVGIIEPYIWDAKYTEFGYWK